MKEFCVDASVAIKLAITEQFTPEAEQLFVACAQKGITIIAPPLIEYEMDSVIRKYVYLKKMTEQAGEVAFNTIDALPIQLTTHPNLRQRAREVAKEHNQVRVYDSTYAALAELKGCDFWTGDERFYNSVKGKLPYVHYIADYKGLP